MHKPNILVIGPSGSGKSTAYEKLPPERTVVIDTENKGFPFRTKFPHVFSVESCPDFYAKLKEAAAKPGIDYIVIDSLTKHFENALNFCRTAFKNYDIWSNYNKHIRDTISACKSKDRTIIGICLDEITEVISTEGTKSNVRRAATLAGKEWDGKIEKEFLLALWTEVKRNEKGEVSYRFLTNTDGICSAKSPSGMLDRYIPTDLKLVADKLAEYYH